MDKEIDKKFLVACTRLYTSLCWSIGPSVRLKSLCLFGRLELNRDHIWVTAPAQLLYCPCPSARDWCCCEYGLVSYSKSVSLGQKFGWSVCSSQSFKIDNWRPQTSSREAYWKDKINIPMKLLPMKLLRVKHAHHLNFQANNTNRGALGHLEESKLSVHLSVHPSALLSIRP